MVNIQCRYWKYGCSRPKCAFKHEHGKGYFKPMKGCWFKAKGTCHFGSKCKYDQKQQETDQPTQISLMLTTINSLKQEIQELHIKLDRLALIRYDRDTDDDNRIEEQGHDNNEEQQKQQKQQEQGDDNENEEQEEQEEQEQKQVSDYIPEEDEAIVADDEEDDEDNEEYIEDCVDDD